MANDEPLTPERIKILRAMTGEQKLKISNQMYWMARRNKRVALLLEHPDWSEEQADKEITRLLMSGASDVLEPFAPTLEEFL
jgi:hypothetical protein